MGFFVKCIETVEACLRDAKMEKSCVNEVILVCGSTRIPKVQCMLQEFFGRKELCKSLNPNEAVAYGAAVMAAKLSGNSHKSCGDLLLLDVTPLSLGVESIGEVFSVVIPRNTPIPTKKSKNHVTIEDNQSKAWIKVYQGERARSTDNHLLGEFLLSGIPPAPKGDAKLEYCFEIDANCTNAKERLSMEQIENMVKDADKYKKEDQEYKRKADAFNELEDCIYNMKKKIRNMENGERLKRMKNAIADTANWLKHNQAASVDELQCRKEHLESKC
ncbi:hypothetical protein Lser_V15G42859 [Lactuca serriola]